jgi:hypothetical protein
MPRRVRNPAEDVVDNETRATRVSRGSVVDIHAIEVDPTPVPGGDAGGGRDVPPPIHQSRRPAAAAGEEFETASKTTRCFLCLDRVLEAKKTCLLILVVSLGVLVQLIHLLFPPETLASSGVQTFMNKTEDAIEGTNRLIAVLDPIKNATAKVLAAHFRRALSDEAEEAAGEH